MHFHLPKPLHGWREFAGEVGIIVVGVLIALGAEQVVETVHDRREADTSMLAVRAELAHSAGVFEERALVQQCLDRRLSELDAIVGEVRRTGRLPDISEIGRPPARPIQSAAWSAATTSDIVTHFDDQKRDALSMIYSQSSTYFTDIIAEQEMWATLRLMEHAPGAIDGALLAEIAGTLARLHFRSFLNGVDARQLVQAIVALRIRPDYAIVNDPGGEHNRGLMLESVRKRSVCAPLIVDGKPVAAVSR
jgi:hypothetical protein